MKGPVIGTHTHTANVLHISEVFVHTGTIQAHEDYSNNY